MIKQAFKKNTHVLVVAVLFYLTVAGLDAVDFWSLAGLGQPQGLLIQGFLFLVLYLVLKTFVFEPYLAIIDQREQLTTQARLKAQQARAKADALAAQVQDQLQNARREAAKLRAQWALAVEDDERQQIVAARKRAQEHVITTQQQLMADSQKAQQILTEQLQVFVTDLTDKVLRIPQPPTSSMRR